MPKVIGVKAVYSQHRIKDVLPRPLLGGGLEEGAVCLVQMRDIRDERVVGIGGSQQ
jgi:hypothetical protein